MDINLASTLGVVKVAMKEASDKASLRHLQIYQEKIKCKPTCSACCSRQIYLTIAEAIIIHEYAKKSGNWPEIENRAKAIMALARDTPPVAWFKMNIMCPILDPITKLCTTYETRPPACSTHFVTSDPKLCDPWHTE